MSGSFGGAVNGNQLAQNGVSYDGPLSSYVLGGDLIRPTVINTDAVNVLQVTGLQPGDLSTDSLLVVAPDGTFKIVTATPKSYTFAQAVANAAVANNAVAVLNWTEVTDVNNDSLAGVFTVPRPGLYAITLNVVFNAAAWAATTYLRVAIRVAGVNVMESYAVSEGATAKIMSAQCSGVLKLTNNQLVTFSILQNSGAAKNLAGAPYSYYTIAEL